MCRPRSGSRSRSRRSWSPRCLRRSRSSCRRINATPGNRAGARCICCKAWCSASTVAMPSMGNPSVARPPKGKPRTYAYYRCLGTDAYRFGGERVCQQYAGPDGSVGPGRVAGSLCVAGPSGAARRGISAPLAARTRAKRQAQPTLEAQLGKLRQGLARLIDSYAEGLIEKQEFEPRITRLRQRLTALEEQRQQLQDEAALQTELRLIIGRLEDFAAKVQTGWRLRTGRANAS